MDRQQVREWENKCIQEQPPACTTTCPVHVDVRTMIESVRKADFARAFSIFSRSIPFPGIISRICDHPCQSACKRSEAGDAVAIRSLERACVAYSERSLTPTLLPKKDQRVAVVGAGLSGLTVAVDLAVKGYDVAVFEAMPRLLDRLLNYDEQILPKSVVLADVAVLTQAGVVIRSDSWVSSGACHALTDEFDAVYLGPGPDALDPGPGVALRPNGHIAIDPLTYATSHPKVFAGGTHRYSPSPYSAITSLHDGRYAALSIDRFLQGASLSANRENQGPYTSRLFVNTRGAAPRRVVAPANPPAGYSKDEAVREAQRCFPCECMECVKVCEYLAHHKSYPKRYVREIYNNDCIVMGQHPSNCMVNTCSLCGLCEAVCPEKLSMAEVCLAARRSMVRKGKMPPSTHEFALRDMAFSQSEAFALARHQAGYSSSAAVFFPGCQLSGSSPEHVVRAYEFLRSKISGGVGLILSCCGAPALWSGQEQKFAEVLRTMREKWEDMGSPRVIAACSTCYRVLKDHMPQVPVESLWTVFDQHELPASATANNTRPLALHDPCTSRQEEGVQESVRHLLEKLGVSATELNQRGLTSCCGYGGLMQFGDPAVADKVVNRRVNENDADYLTYCAMCRDNFARRGKRTVHILDLLFSDEEIDPAIRCDPGFSQRQENRARLKRKLLRAVWGGAVADQEQQLELEISPEVRASMEKRLILVDDVRKVIAHAEASGQKVLNQAGRRVASYRPASVTYWVEYTQRGTAYVIRNAYSHRMEVS